MRGWMLGPDVIPGQVFEALPETPCGRQPSVRSMPQWTTLWKRRDRRGMAAPVAVSAHAAPMRPSSEVGDARDCQRDLLRPARRGCREPLAEGFSAMARGLSLVCTLP